MAAGPSRSSRISDEHGQATGLAAVFLVGLLGMSALVIDVGSWFRADRAAQTAADAAALAGAQAVPGDPGTATSLAMQYAQHNGGGLEVDGVEISGDTIRVHVRREAPGLFARVLGFDSVDVGASAAARAANPDQARWAAPFVVHESHPLLTGGGCPCWNVGTDLDLQKVGPGNFKIVNLDDEKGGHGPPILAGWIRNGFDGFLPLGWYYGDPGAKFNSSQVKAALDARIGTELLLPVYRGIKGNGANLEYEIVGWAGFLLTGYQVKGNNGILQGSFRRVVWEGIQNETGPAQTDFGVRAVALIE